MSFKDFDNVLLTVYDLDSDIDAFFYFSTYFDLLRNQVDVFAIKNDITVENHLEFIKIIKDYEDESIENCRKIFENLKDNLNVIIKKRIELFNNPNGTEEYVKKNIQIRKEWIEARKKVFKKLIFFMEYNVNDESNGCLVHIESCPLDDLQISILK